MLTFSIGGIFLSMFFARYILVSSIILCEFSYMVVLMLRDKLFYGFDFCCILFFFKILLTHLFYCVNIPHFSSSFFYTLATHLNEYYIIHMVIPDYLFYQYWNFYLLRSNLKTENDF